jgi:hypothetical protein
MMKRLQVLFEEQELREIRRAARAQRTTVAEWVRGAVRARRDAEPSIPPERKLAVLRASGKYSFPTADIDQMLAEIERGYLAGIER